MPTHHRKHGPGTLTLVIGTTDFTCQVQSWEYDPGIGEGERMYSFCADDGGFIEEPDPEPSLTATFYSDWRSAGINDFLFANAGTTADVTLEVHPTRAAEHAVFTGKIRVAPGPIGGEANSTDQTEVTFQAVTPLEYARGV